MALAKLARDVLEHHLRAVESRHAAQALRHQPRREHRTLRLEVDAAVQSGHVPGNRLGRPAGSARAALGRHADRGRDHSRRVERCRFDRTFEPRRVAEAQRPSALHLAAADQARELIEVERRRLIGRKAQCAFADNIDWARGELAFEPKLAAERPLADTPKPRRPLPGRPIRSRPMRPSSGPDSSA
jgi:hypothetical protein